MTEQPKRKGVVKVFLDETGRPLAYAPDFEPSTLEEQKVRAGRDLARRVVELHVARQLIPPLASEEERAAYLRDLVELHRCHVVDVLVGWDETRGA